MNIHEYSGMIPFIDTKQVVAQEALLDVASMSSKSDIQKQILLNKQRLNGGVPSAFNEYTKLNSYVVNGEIHVHLDEELFYFDEYILRLYHKINSFTEADEVKLFFHGDYECSPYILLEILPILNTLKLCKANITAVIYNHVNPLMVLIVAGCDNIKIGDFGGIKLCKPNLQYMDNPDILLEMYNTTIKSLVTRGLITQDEYELILDDYSALVCIDSRTLRSRLKQ